MERLTEKGKHYPLPHEWARASVIRKDAIKIAELQNHLQKYEDAEEQGRLVVLPCKVGDTVYIIANCQDVRMSRDDDYTNGTGAIECPFENTCDFEECDDGNMRIFETQITDFWYGEANGEHPEMFAEKIGCGYMLFDFGKTVFLTREAAEAALNKKP